MADAVLTMIMVQHQLTHVTTCPMVAQGRGDRPIGRVAALGDLEEESLRLRGAIGEVGKRPRSRGWHFFLFLRYVRANQ